MGYTETYTKEMRRQNYLANKNKILSQNKQWRKTHRKQTLNLQKEWHVNIGKNKNIQLKFEVLSYYCKNNKPFCVCCGKIGIGYLTIDHINNDGNKHRRNLNLTGGHSFYRYLKNNNFPNDPPLQVLCYNCNNAKRVNFGVCYCSMTTPSSPC